MSSALDQRMKRMKENGIPMPITQMPISEGAASAVPVTAQNQDKHARLAALKSGANRQQVQSLVKASSATGPNGFQGIPEPKMKKNPNHPGNQLSDPSKAVKVQGNFGASAPVSNEFTAMEAMYGGGPDTSAYQAPQQPLLNGNQGDMSTSQPDLAVPMDVGVPTFDPVAMMQQKRAQQVQEAQTQQPGYNYMQHAVNPQAQQNPEQQQFNFQYLQQMMEQIAKQTISEVLNEYTEKNKKKLTYENIRTKGKEKVIKTEDGKYYKLTPVTLTKG